MKSIWSEQLADIDSALGGAITKLIEQGEIKGKPFEITFLHTLEKLPVRIVAVVGLGKKSDVTLDKIRQYSAQASRSLRKMNCQKILISLHGVGDTGIDAETSAQAITEGMYTRALHF